MRRSSAGSVPAGRTVAILTSASCMRNKKNRPRESLLPDQGAAAPRQSVLRAGQCGFRNSILLSFWRTEEPEANFLNAIEDAIVSEARDPGSPGCVRAKKLNKAMAASSSSKAMLGGSAAYVTFSLDGVFGTACVGPRLSGPIRCCVLVVGSGLVRMLVNCWRTQLLPSSSTKMPVKMQNHGSLLYLHIPI